MDHARAHVAAGLIGAVVDTAVAVSEVSDASETEDAPPLPQVVGVSRPVAAATWTPGPRVAVAENGPLTGHRDPCGACPANLDCSACIGANDAACTAAPPAPAGERCVSSIQ